MSEGKPPTYAMISHRQLLSALALMAGINGVPLYVARNAPPDAEAEKAIARIGTELSAIRETLVVTQIETSKALATAMQELNDHSRRLDSLEGGRRAR